MAVADPARPSPANRIRAALWFAEHGFGVFSVWSATDAGVCRCPKGSACSSPGKHPITENGFKNATQDPDRIKAMLSAGSNPNYGLVNPDGVFAWDLDGEGWQDRLHGLEDRLGPLPPTLTTLTANGEHRFFRWPDEHPRPVGALFGWVTRWRSGQNAGYVIGPRSVHPSGREYAPGNVFEIATLPEPWAEAILAELAPKPGVIQVTAGGYQLPPFGYDGSRYNAILSYAASRYLRGITRDETKAACRAMLLPRFAHPLTEEEFGERFDRAWDAQIERRLGPPMEEPVVDEETGRVVRLNDELDFPPDTDAGEFPPDPDPVAFTGVIGDVVEQLAVGTDASKVGLLGCALAFLGVYLPSQAHWKVTNTSSPFVALIGESGTGGKGTAMRRVRQTFRDVWPEVKDEQFLVSGLNSGEALVKAMAKRRQNGNPVALLYEAEYGRMLVARQREGSSIDFMVRLGFDGDDLQNHRVDDSMIVTPPYWLSACVGITPTELGARLGKGDLSSGSANRWLYLPVRRRSGETDAAPQLAPDTAERLRLARTHIMRTPNPLSLEPAVTGALNRYGEFLAAEYIGSMAELVKRLDVLAMRIALVHATAERSAWVTMEHLGRALALTEYARRGLSWVFTRTLDDPIAELIWRHLQGGPLTYRQITRDICRDSAKRQAALDELRRFRLTQVVSLPTAKGVGRPRKVLQAAPTGRRGGFVHFVHGFVERPEPATDGVTHATQGINRTEPGINGTELGQNRDRTGQNPQREPGRGGEWLNECLWYSDHLWKHRQTPDGWTCDACYPTEENA